MRRPMRINLLFVTSLVLGICMASEAQNGHVDSSGLAEPQIEFVTLNPALKVGDEVKLELTKKREIKRDGKSTTTPSSSCPTSVRVLEINTNGAVLLFELGSIKVDDNLSSPTMDRLMESIGGGTRMEVVLDSTWEANSVRNWRELQAIYRKALDVMFDFPEAKELTDDQRRKARELVEERVGSEEAVNAMALEDVQAYTFVWGWQLPIGELREVEDYFPNPFGGEPIPAKKVLRLTEYVPGVRARVTLDVIIDEEKAATILRETADAMLRRFGHEPSGERMVFSRTSRAEFDLDLRSGWVRHARWENFVTTPGVERHMILEWRIVDTAAAPPS